MRLVLALALLPLVFTTVVLAETPTRTPAPTLAPTPAVTVAPAAEPAPSSIPPASGGASPGPAKAAAPKRIGTPVTERRALIDALGTAELTEAVKLLQKHYIDPSALESVALQRAQLEGLLARLGPGASLVARGSLPTPEQEDALSPFRTEILSGPAGYIRLGSLTREHLAQLDQTLRDFAAKKIGSLILDLRATPVSSDFDLAAQAINRFVPKGRPLFTLRKPGTKEERLFTSSAEPLYAGFVVLVLDGATSGAAEVVGAVTRLYARSMVVGVPSAGQAVEYADLALDANYLLRVAVAEVVPPQGVKIFPDGVRPDLRVEGAPTGAERDRVLKAALEPTGISGVLYDPERLRLNEATLVAGLNPEVELIQDAQRRRANPSVNLPRDIVLQRAFDLLVGIAVSGPAVK